MAKSKQQDQQDQLINLQAQQLAAQVANWAAQLDFQKARFTQLEMPQWQQASQLDVDKFAYEQAQNTWENTFKEATLTGMYQGVPTIDWMTRQAQLTGVYNGQETMEGKLTDAQITQMNQQMKLANDQFLANTTGYYNGQPTFDREKFNATQAQAAWQFVSTLSGPQNAFKQARAIATMPGGMKDMMTQWLGTNTTPGSTAVGSGGSASAGDLLLGANGDRAPAAAPILGPSTSAGVNYGVASPFFQAAPQPAPLNENSLATASAAPSMAGAASIPGYTYSPAGAQAPVDAWNYTPTPTGNTQVYPPGVVSPANTPDVSTQSAIPPAQANALGASYAYGGTATPAAPASATTPVSLSGIGNAPGTLLPNQINAKNYNNSYTYQQDLGWAQYEDQGWDKGLAQQAFAKSLPTYGGPKSGSVSAW